MNIERRRGRPKKSRLYAIDKNARAAAGVSTGDVEDRDKWKSTEKWWPTTNTVGKNVKKKKKKKNEIH